MRQQKVDLYSIPVYRFDMNTTNEARFGQSFKIGSYSVKCIDAGVKVHEFSYLCGFVFVRTTFSL